MYAVLNPDGTLFELRAGAIEATTNTRNRQKRYAVSYTEIRPELAPGEQHVFDRRDVTADAVTDVFRIELIPPAVPTLDQRVDGLVAALIKKGLLTAQEVEREIRGSA